MDPTNNEEWAALCRAQTDTIERLVTAKNTAEQRVAELSNLLVVSEAANGAKQAEIDRLMLEFCPAEMSPEQMAAWEASQHAVPYGNADRNAMKRRQLEALAALQQHAQAETREQAEQRQREAVAKQFAGRAQTQATADFDLPAASDGVEHAQAALSDGEIADIYRDTFNYSDDIHMQGSHLRFARALLAASQKTEG